MSRNLSLVLVSGLLTACAGSGLGQLDADAGYANDLFATGSSEELRLAEQLAYEHLEADAKLIEGVDEIWTSDVVIDELATAHVRLTQTVSGVPVFGSETIVHLQSQGALRAVSDQWVRHIDVDTTPLYVASEALDLAAEATGGWGAVTNVPDAEMMVLRHSGADHLVYKVDIHHLDGTERTSMPRVFVDAHTGEVVWQYDNLQTLTGQANTAYNGSIEFPVTNSGNGYVLRGEGVGTYTFENFTPNSSTISARDLEDVRSSNTNFIDDVAADGHFGIHSTNQYFEAVHGRDGIDGFGGPSIKDGVINAGVHYGFNYNNAFWNGRTIVFGDGDGTTFTPLTSLDVAAHELAHGVTQNSAGLVYLNESGALNESMSDVFGALVEHWVEGDSADIWKIGEDCYSSWNSNDAMRYMDNPTADNSSRDHYSTRYIGSQNNGGVHWNSGIANLAFVLAADGGSHPRSFLSVTTVDGVGKEAAGQIWYRGLTQYMTSNTGFAGARVAMVQAAEDLYGTDSPEAIAVANAWAEVGVGNPVAAPSTPTPNNPTPGDQGNTPPTEADTLSASTGDQLDFTVDVPPNATELRVVLSGGSGDADLYVRNGAVPTATEFDCRPYQAGNNEECIITNPAAGTWYVGVNAYQTFSGVELDVDLVVPEEEPEPEFESGQVGLDDLAAPKGDETRYTVTIPEGASQFIVRTTGGTGDVDLYVSFNGTATQSNYDCRPYEGGNEEECVFDNPAAGDVSLMLHAWSAYTGLTIEASWN